MERKPENRYRNAAELLSAVSHMSIYDKRYKWLVRRQFLTQFLLLILTAGSVCLLFYGKLQMQNEKKDAYNKLLNDISVSVQNQNLEEAEKYLEEAVSIYPDNPQPYYQLGVLLYNEGKYQESIDFLTENIYDNHKIIMNEETAPVDYLVASCYFEMEEYQNALFYYQRAIESAPAEKSYKTDYIITLARTGDIEKAEAVMESIANDKVDSDTLSLLEGEISFAAGNMENAKEALENCILNTGSDYVEFRAYMKLDDVYLALYSDATQYEQRMNLLEKASISVAGKYKVTILEKLVQVYIDYADITDEKKYCQSAISLLCELEDMNYATYTSRMNIAVLYGKCEDYESAINQLKGMAEIYPLNYEIYKRMAFMEAQLQSTYSNDKREYLTFLTYYEKTMELYSGEAGQEDMEIPILEQVYKDLVTNKWLEE